MLIKFENVSNRVLFDCYVSNRVLFDSLLLTTCRGNDIILARGISLSQPNTLYAFILITLGMWGMNMFSEMYISWWPEMDMEASEMMLWRLLCSLCLTVLSNARVSFFILAHSDGVFYVGRMTSEPRAHCAMCPFSCLVFNNCLVTATSKELLRSVAAQAKSLCLFHP